MSKRLAEVARKVGVSEATVSRVLNEKPGVSESTRQAVLTALDVLGYERPTKLRGERARLVGLVLPELQNPIFPAFAEVVSGALAQQGFTPGPVYPDRRRRDGGRLHRAPALAAVSGVVFAGGLYAQADAPHEHYPASPSAACRRCWSTPRSTASVPARLVRRHGRRSTRRWATCARSATRGSALLVGPADHVPSRRKIAAARILAAKAGIALGPDHIAHSLYSLEAAQAAATRLLARGVTGIVCASDPMALGAIRAVRRAGRDVPDDVSVVGFDDSALMNCTDPPLTTVRQPIEPMGRMVIELLIGQIARDLGPARRVTSSSPSSSSAARPDRCPIPPDAAPRRPSRASRARRATSSR